MKRLLLVSSLLVLSSLLMFAQYQGQSSASSSADTNQTVQGCLSGSDGNYTLTDKSGTAYQLTGDTSKLANHVGHTIQITGNSTTAKSSTGSAGGNSMSGATDTHATLNVTSFKHVSTSCDSSH